MLYSCLYIYIFRVLQLLPMQSEQVLGLGAWIKWSVIGEPHTSVTALSMCVCVSILFGPTTYRKFQMSTLKFFTMMMSTLACTSVSCETYLTIVKGCCQTAGSVWKRARAKTIQVKCIGSTHSNLLSELWWFWRSRDKAGYEWQAAGSGCSYTGFKYTLGMTAHT